MKHRLRRAVWHLRALPSKVPGLKHYCHRCDRILWGWQKCQHKPRWWVG